jgi:hypothetical protein
MSLRSRLPLGKPTSAWSVIGAIVCFSVCTHAQIDSLSTAESTLEHLVEQGGASDDSPILDDLAETPDVVSMRIRMNSTLHPSAGFLNDRYHGSRVRAYERLTIRPRDNCSAALLLEKDPGEVKLNDFMTGNAAFTNFGLLSKLVLGDFVVEAGQGVGLWRGYSAAKGAEVIGPAFRRGRGLTPYCSTGEDAFLRGAGGEFRADRLTMTLFVSRVQRSAVLDTSGAISSFSADGLFRTDAELERKNNITEHLTGFRCALEPAERSAVGVTWYTVDYSRPLRLNPAAGFGSFDYSISLPRAVLFGEWGGGNGIIGGLAGLLLLPLPGAEIVASLRRYPPGLCNLRGAPLGERGVDEDGMYLGLRLRLENAVSLATFYDRFGSSGGGFPSSGHELLLQGDVTFRHLAISLSYRSKSTADSRTATTAEGLTRSVSDQLRREHGRVSVNYRLSPTLRLRTRLDAAFLRGEFYDDRGLACYQEVMFCPVPSLSVNVRITLFDAPSRDVGLSEVERDLPGVASMPALIGTGIRWYLILAYTPSHSLAFTLKYAELTRDDVRRIGSGLDELPGNRDARLGLQLDAGF